MWVLDFSNVLTMFWLYDFIFPYQLPMTCNALKMSLARSFVDLRWQFLLCDLRFDQQKKLAHC